MLFATAGISLASMSCSLEEKGNSTIRAHDDSISGISHAFSSHQAKRYCTQCHGSALSGGDAGEPSCFQCHGENWLDIDPNTPRGDANHTVNNAGYFHHSGISDPIANCTQCHGNELQGATTRSGNPSCFLCHGQKW
ncbi:hypothetical protein N9D31_03920 [Oligoflexaceae bacterium]|nr:hypothetical protein [Oligoflexaceae bacterium]